MSRPVSIEQLVAHDLHNLVYLEEFVFAATRFAPRHMSEVELADAAVAISDSLFVFQMKERSLEHAGTAEDEQTWFEKKVIKQASKQVGDTVNYLSSQEQIVIKNNRGREFDLSSDKYAELTKIILYKAAQNLPERKASGKPESQLHPHR